MATSTYVTNESPDKISSYELRGRRRRQARRHGHLALNLEADFPVSLRGRSRRRHKRHLRLTAASQMSSTQHAPLVRKSLHASEALQLSRSASMALTSGSSKRGLRTPSSNWQKTKVSSDAEAIPSWVLDASIRLPIHFRRISSYFGSVKTRVRCFWIK
jgi:hypothetical protein